MVKAFKRCGLEDDSYSQISDLSDDVCDASTEILAAFSHWAETFLSTCRNNQVHIDRVKTKWSNIYKTALGCAEYQSVVAINPNTHRFCEYMGSWSAECSPEECYSFVHELDYFYNYETGEDYYEDFTCEFTLSTECDPDFIDRDGYQCDWYENWNKCAPLPNAALLRYGIPTSEGFKTGLNCPVCGCDENGPISMHDRDDIDQRLTGDDKKIKRNKRN